MRTPNAQQFDHDDDNSNNKNTFDSYRTIDLTFQCPELPHTHIEQCVSLYNTGLYDDLLLVDEQRRRHGTNGIATTNKIGPTNWLSATTKQWARRRRRGMPKTMATVPSSISKLTSPPYHRPYAATVLRHIRPERELEQLPLQYFVGITHSGHSVSPFRDDCWAKHAVDGGCYEETVDGQHLNPEDYHFPANTLFFAPLQRIERANELGTHPRRAYCRDFKKAKSLNENGEQFSTRIGAILRLKTVTSQSANEWPPMSSNNGPYKLLRPAKQLAQTDIESTICRNHTNLISVNCAQNETGGKSADDGNDISRHTAKKTATIFVTPKSIAEYHDKIATNPSASSINRLQIIEASPTAQEAVVNELYPATELLSAPIGSCIDQKQQQQKEQSAQKPKSVNEGGKYTARITVTTSIIVKDTVKPSDSYNATGTDYKNAEDTIEQQHGQQNIHLLNKKEELMDQPIERFVPTMKERSVVENGNHKGRTRKKYIAKIVLKATEIYELAPKEVEKSADEKQLNASELHLLNRKCELVCHPIGEFVALAKNGEKKRTEIVGHGGAKPFNKKFNAKIIMKPPQGNTICPREDAEVQQLHLLNRHEELMCQPLGEFVASTNKRNSGEAKFEESKTANSKKYVAKIVTKSTKTNGQAQQLNAQDEMEQEKEARQERSEELKYHPLVDLVTAAPLLTTTNETNEKHDLEQVEQKKEFLVADEVKRLSRKRKRSSAKMAFLGGFWQQIGATKDKQKKKGKKKKADHEKKKAQNQNGQQKATATTTSASSSSSSSSSSDAETEQIHVLVQDEEQKRQQMPPINDQQQQDGSMGASPPPAQSHTTTSVRTWHEQSSGPQRVTTEVDEHGNVIRRVVTTEHVRHTVQTHSYQTMSTGEDSGNSNPPNATVTAEAQQANATPASPPPSSLKSPPPVPPARRRNSATTAQAQQVDAAAGEQSKIPASGNSIGTAIENGGTTTMNGGDDIGELVATKVVTTGNRTIETLTYKKERDGLVETRVEHRITIHSNEDIDHEAELDRAISEATKMNPHMKVEKVEVERTSSP